MNYKEVIMKKTLFSVMLCILIPTTSYSLNFKALLTEGPVITVRKDKKNRFDDVRAFMIIKAPAELIMKEILNYKEYKKFMPKVDDIEVKKINRQGTIITVDIVLDTPLTKTKYRIKNFINYQNYTIDTFQVKGDLKGSHWHWKFYKQTNNRTMVEYVGITKNFSVFLETFDDKDKTISMGINISSVMATMESIKKRAETVFRNTDKK